MFCNKNKINWEDHDKLRECVRSFMGEPRYIHTLGVEGESEKLAEMFGCGRKETKKIKTAALLHDITKEFSREKQLEICGKYKIKLTGDDLRVEKGWHAITAAYIARHEFGACDTVFDAIYNHTFGALLQEFLLPAKIIYLADYIEPGRAHKDCIAVREYFYKNKNLDETLFYAMNTALQIVLNENLFMHKSAVEYRNSFINCESE